MEFDPMRAEQLAEFLDNEVITTEKQGYTAAMLRAANARIADLERQLAAAYERCAEVVGAVQPLSPLFDNSSERGCFDLAIERAVAAIRAAAKEAVK